MSSHQHHHAHFQTNPPPSARQQLHSSNIPPPSRSPNTSPSLTPSSVPAAPYPPLMPLTPSSVLVSQPQYLPSSVAKPSRTNKQQAMKGLVTAAPPPPPQQGRMGAASGMSAEPSAADAAAADRRVRSLSGGDPRHSTDPNTAPSPPVVKPVKPVHPSHVQFCPGRADLYGCVNCLPPVGDINTASAMAMGTAAGNLAGGGSRVKKLGPVLLELRRLGLVTPMLPTSCSTAAPWIEDEMQHPDQMASHGNNMESRSRREVFRSRIVAVSRGNPALGGSVASTCLSFKPSHDMDSATTSEDQEDVIRCATGLTSGALCVHTISNLTDADSETFGDGAASALRRQMATTTVTYYAPRHHRPATSVAWRPLTTPGARGHVAVGLVGSHHHSHSQGGQHRRGLSERGAVGGGGGDREFCCLVWDVAAQSGGGGAGRVAGTPSVGPHAAHGIKTPAYRFAHNCGVSSLAWPSDGHTLAVGTSQIRGTLQLYDLRVSGTNVPPLSVYAHADAVNGIQVDPHRSHVFATFSRGGGEAVKLWDVRRMDSCVGEIKTGGFASDDLLGGDGTMVTGGVSGVTDGGGQKQKGATAASATTSGRKTTGQASAGGRGSNNGNGGPVVSAITWSSVLAGTLSVAIGSTIRNFDTTGSSRPVLTRINYAPGPVRCLAFHPREERTQRRQQPQQQSKQWEDGALPTDQLTATAAAASSTIVEPSSPETACAGGGRRDQILAELYPHRMLVVTEDGNVFDIPKFQVAPLAISRRDGRVAHSLGSTVWVGPTTDGPSAMESMSSSPMEDVSAIMMRRARCLHEARYSTDATTNLQMLTAEEEQRAADQNSMKDDGATAAGEEEYITSNRDELVRLWSWIARVEYLSSDREHNADAVAAPPGTVAPPTMDETTQQPPIWPGRAGLMDAGVSRLLRMDEANAHDATDDYHLLDVVTFSESLRCNTYDSPMRRAAMNSCGWIGKFGLRDVLADCETRGHYERAAALAVWHGDLGEAVSALQRGADAVRSKLLEHDNKTGDITGTLVTPRYAETLQLVAMCIAGYSGYDANNSNATSRVWRNACESLLQRDDLSSSATTEQSTMVPYLRAVCTFLVNVGQDDGLDKVLYDETLSLCDRVAFACRFLSRTELRSYLGACVRQCQVTGNIEGLLITGLERRGIALLQSYVDRYSDVQTAALVSSRVILPVEWVRERVICSEWLDSYRDLLNTWQMWQSRAMFDVGRSELLRRIRSRQQTEDIVGGGGRGPLHQHQGRLRGPYGKKQALAFSASSNSKQQSGGGVGETSVAMFPPQLYARCNYCNTSLPLSRLRRQEGIANSWLSRQKPVLSCCPQCRKPLPRCAICLLPLGCLNPYMELRRERSRSSSRGGGGGANDDLSELANLPFAEWFTWCMRCKHGGHAHHMVGWFANHETCAVSGCDCRCQFDGIQKLCRPALTGKEG